MSERDDRRAVLEQRALRYRHRLGGDEAPADTIDVVVFERGGALYGVPITSLSAIRRAASLTLLPGLSPAVKGLANVQGRLVAVHDIGSFAKAPRPLGAEIWLLLCRGAGAGVALLADDVHGVRSVVPSQLAPPPVSLDSIRDCFIGFGEDGVAYLDLPRLLSNDDFFHA